jgi:hypothetical protein
MRWDTTGVDTREAQLSRIESQRSLHVKGMGMSAPSRLRRADPGDGGIKSQPQWAERRAQSQPSRHRRLMRPG